MKIAQQRQYDLIADPSAIKFEQRHEGSANLVLCAHRKWFNKGNIHLLIHSQFKHRHKGCYSISFYHIRSV